MHRRQANPIGRLGAGLLTLALLLPGAGCNSKKSPAEKGAGEKQAKEVVVYTDRGKKFLEPIAAAFTKKTGIKVTLHTAGSIELLTRLKTEGKETPCDVFLSKDSATLEKAREEGLFSKIDKAELEKVPAEFRAADDSWIGLSARARVIVYNTRKIKPEQVTSVFDLARPEYAGKVGTVKSDNGSFITGVTSLLVDHGRAKVALFLKGLKTNSQGHVFPKHTPTVKAVAKGEIALGLVNHYYFYRHLAKDPKAPIGIIFPDQQGKGSAWNVAGVGIARSAKHTEAAKAFIKFLVSAEGQQIFSEQNFEYPVNPEVATHPAVKPRKEFKLTAVGVEQMGKNRPEAVALIQETGLD